MKGIREKESKVLVGSPWIQHFPAMVNNLVGITLVVHGLNNTSSIMDDIVRELSENGSEVIQLQLTGHRNNGQSEINKATIKDWLNDLEEAYSTVKNISQNHQNIPVYFVGFSLGALLNLVSMTKNEKMRYNKILLFAPALSLTLFSSIVRLLKAFPPGLLLPNITPRPYKANTFTPVRAYQNLLGLINTLNKHDLKNLNIPTKIIVDPKDELVSLKGIKRLKEKNNLSNWQIIPLQQPFFKKIHHLIVAKQYLSSENWEKLRGIIREMVWNG
ncbi:alpha/beta hydrolase [Flexithrix dorotheae]|uniref:alpha/beta hydrolase n=1 Tax=Flexithrix dorotheae TaxID=70993 RepID=UPI000380C302|nr:alpha/beta hydrolase [Flexithrix dorotheae]